MQQLIEDIRGIIIIVPALARLRIIASKHQLRREPV